MQPSERRPENSARPEAAAVRQRLYAALRAHAGTSIDDVRLCAKLASLAERLYRQRTLDDTDLAEILHHLTPQQATHA